MGLHVFLEQGRREDIRRADMIFAITRGPVRSPWTKRPVAHVGIAARNTQGYSLNVPIDVYDMSLESVEYGCWHLNCDGSVRVAVSNLNRNRRAVDSR